MSDTQKDPTEDKRGYYDRYHAVLTKLADGTEPKSEPKLGEPS